MATYVYPGNKSDFYNDYGGLPDTSAKPLNILIVTIIIIGIILILMGIAFYITQNNVTLLNHTGLINLDNLKDLNNPSVQCCVFVGETAPNQQYVYDTAANITYSRQVPLNINTVCSTFANQANCVAQNTDANGNIIPVATFQAVPYYTFESGLFNACQSTKPC